MSTPRGPNIGIKLLAAGLVFGVGALIQVVQDEPSGPLLVLAIVLIGLGLKFLWRQNSGRLPDTRASRAGRYAAPPTRC